jgi:hypothetical protein
MYWQKVSTGGGRESSILVEFKTVATPNYSARTLTGSVTYCKTRKKKLKRITEFSVLLTNISATENTTSDNQSIFKKKFGYQSKRYEIYFN